MPKKLQRLYTQPIQERHGVLLVNLGTPSAPNKKMVGKFLRQFLSDPLVVPLPRVLWLPLLYLVVVPLRLQRVTESYQKIWMQQGSPLAVYMQKLQQKMQLFYKKKNTTTVVEYAMVYGEVHIKQGLSVLWQQGITHLHIVPMYPQYSLSTNAAVSKQVFAAIQTLSWQPSLRIVQGYWANKVYIDIWVERIQKTYKQGKIVVCFHGLPEVSVSQGDPYYQMCLDTFLALQLRLPTFPLCIAFQSRFGLQKWLQPYLQVVITELALAKQDVLICTPGFAVDCLETLEELAVYAEEYQRMHKEGEIRIIPCLNDSDEQIHVLRSVLDLE